MLSFITAFTLALVGFCITISDLGLQNHSTIILLNFLLFTFLFLPLHTCYRVLLYKKFQQFSSAPKVEIELRDRIWFTTSRLIFLGLATVIIFLIATYTKLKSIDRSSKVFLREN